MSLKYGATSFTETHVRCKSLPAHPVWGERRSEVMGVYIKGMEMPKDCTECMLNYLDKFGYPHCCITSLLISYGKTNGDCPLTEVPEPHGRLIDIEDIALLKTVSCGGLSAKKLWKRIKEQPTIIERSNNE